MMETNHHTNIQHTLEILRDNSGHPVDPCDLLDELVLLRGMPYHDLNILGKYLQAYRVEAGVVLFQEGERNDTICFVVSGNLTIFKESEQGDRRHLATIRAGKCVGEMSLIDHSPPSATVVTEDTTTLLILTKQNIERLRDEHPRLAFDLLLKIAQLLSFRLRHTTGQLIDYL